jgi:hypothetical protein
MRKRTHDVFSITDSITQVQESWRALKRDGDDVVEVIDDNLILPFVGTRSRLVCGFILLWAVNIASSYAITGLDRGGVLMAVLLSAFLSMRLLCVHVRTVERRKGL